MSRRIRKCRSCKQEVNANAMQRHSGQCIGCYNTDQRKRRAERMPDDLKMLADQLGPGTPLTDWESQFVSGLVQRYESGSIQHLSAGQAGKVAEIAAKRGGS